ncbi:MAG: GGDEF domain-containing protein [Thermoguttaceae bacterium]
MAPGRENQIDGRARDWPPAAGCPRASSPGPPSVADQTLDCLPVPILVIDATSFRVRRANRLACAALGYLPGELHGVELSSILNQADIAALQEQLDHSSLDGASTVAIRTVERRKDRVALPAFWRVSQVSDGDSHSWVVVANESSDAQPVDAATAISADLGRLGHDPLTGLPDRRLFDRRLARAIERSQDRPDYLFAVCFIDLDGFKAVNDRLGHLAGDRLLCEVACRLVGCTRPGDMAARYGGDEFTVFVDDLHGPDDALLVAKRIVSRLAAPIGVDGHEFPVSASVGIAISSADCRRGDELLATADRAMYHVKRAGGGDVALLYTKRTFRPAKPR